MHPSDWSHSQVLIQGETTALGAAFLAGLATGVWADLPALERTWKRRDRFEPAMPPELRTRLIRGWRDAVGRTLA